MRTILVTGGAGFIGSHVCDGLLAQGERVVAVDNLSGGRLANLEVAKGYGDAFSFRRSDIRSEELRTVFDRNRPEVVMHLAAQSSVSVSVTDPTLDASLNVMGLLNVLECSVETGVRKVVFAASGGTLYGTPRRLPVKETSRRNVNRVSPYGISKAVAVEYLNFYRHHRGLDFTALALSNVFGPRQDPFGEAGVVAIFGAKMLKGEIPTIFGDGEQTRDYVFVQDVARAFVIGADRASGLVVNVGTGRETSVNRIFRLLARATGFRGRPDRGPWRQGDITRTSLNVDLAAAELRWKPKVSLEKGLGITVESLRTG